MFHKTVGLQPGEVRKAHCITTESVHILITAGLWRESERKLGVWMFILLCSYLVHRLRECGWTSKDRTQFSRLQPVTHLHKFALPIINTRFQFPQNCHRHRECLESCSAWLVSSSAQDRDQGEARNGRGAHSIGWQEADRLTTVFKDVISCLITETAWTATPQSSQGESVETGRNFISCSEVQEKV